MELKQALDEKLFDYRIRDRLVGEGKLKKEDLDKYFNGLPDVASNATTLGEADSKAKDS
jgi:hypothetical protein